ncbi:plasminogen activator, urokinase a [Spinachia spinachia]
MNLLVIIAAFAAFSIDGTYSRKRDPRTTNRETCWSGDGSSYRGTASDSASGRSCLNWNWFNVHPGASNGLGDHSYCRNPDGSLMPWCRVRRGRRIVREFCNIPTCSTPTTKPPSAVDTERTCGETSERRLQKIVGGSFTPIESHPWVAALFHRRAGFLCGGSLIAPCWVLTAAHCFSEGEANNIRHLSVYLGKTAINDTDAEKEQRFTVEKVIIHQKYNWGNYNNDIALLKIKSRNGGCAVRSSSARTVCLPPSHTQLPVAFHCSIAGFGNERFRGQKSQILKQAVVQLLAQTDCASKLHYGDLITENMLCAGSPDWSIDACNGDSGGPLVCEVAGRMFLFGVVSWGDGCARRNKPGVYTRVTNYNKWIEDNTGLSKFTKGLMYPIK